MGPPAGAPMQAMPEDTQGMQPSLMDAPPQQPPPQQQFPEAPQPGLGEFPPQQAIPQEQYPPQDQGLEYREQMDEVEALIESIIDEKWQGMVSKVGDLDVWKSKLRTDVQSIKQELVRIQARFETLEKAVLGKITEYDKNMMNVGAEIKAVEKVLEKVMQPMTQNIKELKKLTTSLKRKKK